jgi:hypothetical protein
MRSATTNCSTKNSVLRVLVAQGLQRRRKIAGADRNRNRIGLSRQCNITARHQFVWRVTGHFEGAPGALEIRQCFAGTTRRKS